jgi:endonuclease YncB( thermonuclease family)
MENTELESKLMKTTLDNTPRFTLETGCKREPAHVIDVLDGDTCTVAMYKFDNIWAFRIRLAYIDAPELRPRLSCPNRIEVIRLAIEAKGKLMNLVDDRIIWIKIIGTDKFGRLLGILYANDNVEESINAMLVATGHAVWFGRKQIK